EAARMLVEDLGVHLVRRDAGHAVAAEARVPVEVKVAVGVGGVEPEAVARVDDRSQERHANTGFEALVHRAVRIHDRAGTPGCGREALQLVAQLRTVERNVPGEVATPAARADL